MPIYEYACAKCDGSFEELIVRRSDEADVCCPRCQAKDVHRLMSAPSAAPSRGNGGGRAAPARGCGPVG